MISLDDLNSYKSNLYVNVLEFGEYSINILIYCFSTSTKYGDCLKVQEDILLNAKDILEKNNINFAYPKEYSLTT